MKRREVIAGLIALVWPPLARSQQGAQIPRIGYLSPGSAADAQGHRNQNALRQGLHDLGLIEGRSIVIEYRFAERDFSRLPELAAQLVRRNVAVIVAGPTPAAVAAAQATRTVPIVMVNTGDPVGLELVESLARPGGNVTGLAFTVGTDAFRKGLELLAEAVPGLGRVAVLSNPNNPAQKRVLSAVEATAHALNIEPISLEARHPDDFGRAFAAMAEQRVRAVYVMPDVLLFSHASQLAALALERQLPSLYQFREEVEAGGLMSYGHINTEPWRRAATFVDQLLKGAAPGDLPVQQPTKFELVINLKTARALRLSIQSALLARADEVIE
jgi:putative ABC transport system substrate-binding protein